MAPPDSNDPEDDRKAKDVLDSELDPATMADLARWFGLPSFADLEDSAARAVPPEHPEVAAVRERRAQAVANVDPELLEAHRRRTEPPDDLLKFAVNIDVRVDPSISRLDMMMIDRAVAEPREVEISEELRDDMHDCTPQAILRDLHRPEIDFDKLFEIVDVSAEQRLDIVAEVEAAMTTRWQLDPAALATSPVAEARAVLDDLRAERRQSWAELLAAQPLPNRTWSPEEDR